MPVASFDHVALPTSQPEAMIAFYGALGFTVPDVDAVARRAACRSSRSTSATRRSTCTRPGCGSEDDFTLRGPTAKPGCGDLCFVWEGGAERLHETLAAAKRRDHRGPVKLPGARGSGVSVYTRDPDDNLLEFIIYE
jgi:catechol 2,3-dioxygenase-like lactoylglutathione lyase family enzyme